MAAWRAKTILLALSVLNLNVTCNRAPAETTENPGVPTASEEVVTLAGIDVSGLTTREHRQWSSHVTELLAPCPDQPVNLAQCVRESRACASCVPAAKFLVRQVRQGRARSQVETAFRLRFAPEEVKAVEVGDAPVKGPGSAPVTIIEWADFECPFCAAASPELDKAVQRFEPHVKLAFKHYPLSSHEHAEHAARAAVAAQKQGKFWPMHKKLFENQGALDRKSLLRYAKELGLDEKQFAADLDSEAVADHVARDRKQAEKFGLKGTPMIYINGRRYEIESFNLLEDLEDWLALEVSQVTGQPFAPKPTTAPAGAPVEVSEAADAPPKPSPN